MNPTPIAASLKAAETAIADGQYKDALQHCKAALKADKKSSEALILIGVAAYHLKEYDQAELAYRRALEVNSDLIPAWQGLADLFQATNNPKGQVEANERLLQLTTEEDPNDRTARIRLAQAYNSLGDVDNAIQQYNQLLQKEQPGTPERLTLLCSLADILLQRDERLAAEEMQAKLQSTTSPTSRPSTPTSPLTALIDINSHTTTEGQQQQPSLSRARRTISCIELDVLAAQAAAQAEALDANHHDLTTAAVLHEIAHTAPSALIYLSYREEHLRRCLLRIFHAPRRSTERQLFRLEALKECVSMICQGGPCSPLGYEAAVWLLEEEEEMKGGQVSVGGQEVGGSQALAGGVQVGAEGHIGAGRDATVAYASENFSRRMYHQFPTNPTARVLLALMLRRHAVHDKRPISQAERRRLERLLSLAMEEGSHIDCASGFKALAELQYDNRHYEQAIATVMRGMKWLQQRRDRGHEALTQVALSLRLILAKSLRRCGKLDEAEHHFAALAGWVSEGEAGFAELCGSTPTSIHQQALRGLALVALARGDATAARAQYERILGKAALGRGPAEHWAHSDYGWLLYQNKEYQCAREHLEQAIQVAEEEGCSVTDSQLAEHKYRLGEVYWSMKGRYRSEKQFAYQHFLEGAKVEGHAQAHALAALGRYFEIVEKQPEQAQRCFKKALSIDPSVDLAGDGLCALLIRQNRKHAALTLCKEISTRSPHAAWAWKRMGLLLIDDKHYSDAIAALQSALRINPKDAVAWEALGAAYQPLGRFTAALKVYSRSLELDSTREYSLIQSGNLSLALGNAAAALELFEKALLLSHTTAANSSNDNDNSSNDNNSSIEKRKKTKRRHPSALLGAAESLLAIATVDSKLGVLVSASSSLNRAREYAQECTLCYPTLISGWKMLGDIYMMLRHMDDGSSSNSNSSDGGSRGDDSSNNTSSMDVDNDTTTTTSVIPKSRYNALSKARKAYSAALHLHPGMASLWHDIAATSYHQIQLYRAYSSISDTTNTTNNSNTTTTNNTTTNGNNNSLLLQQEQNRQLSERMLKGALRLDPANSELWMAMGAVSLDPVIREYSLCRSLQLNPRSATAWSILARVYIDAGIKDLADLCLQHARSHEATAPWIWEAMAASTELSIHSLQSSTGLDGDSDVSLSSRREELKKERAEYAEHAVGLGAGAEGLAIYAEAALRRGAITAQHGDGDGKERKKPSEDGVAYTAAHRAYKLAPYDASVMNTWAIACEVKGDSDGAIVAYRKALRRLSDSSNNSSSSSSSSGGRSSSNNNNTIDSNINNITNTTTTINNNISSSSSSSWLTTPLIDYPSEHGSDYLLDNSIAIRSAVQLNLGRVLCRIGRYKDAIAVYSSVLTHNNTTRDNGSQYYAWMTYAIALAAEDDENGAEHAMHAALDGASTARDGDGVVAAVEGLMTLSFLFRKKEQNASMAFDLLQENIPRLKESNASLSGIKRLWYIAMTHTVVINSNSIDSSSSDVVQDVYNAAHKWIQQQHDDLDAQGADAASFIAQLHALKSISSSSTTNRNNTNTNTAMYAEYCKALHVDPSSKNLRIATVESAIHTSPHYASLIDSTIYNNTNNNINTTTTTSSSEWKSVVATEIAALLSRCIAQCKTHCQELLRRVTAAVHAEPTDADTWYYAAVLSVQLASLTQTRAQYVRARSWCRIALMKNKENGLYATYLSVYFSECLLHINSNSNNEALDVAIAAVETSSSLSPAVHAMALRQVARCYWSMKQTDKAMEYFNQSLTLLHSNNDNNTTNNTIQSSLVIAMEMAHMLEQQGKATEATTILSQHIHTAQQLTTTTTSMNDTCNHNDMIQYALLRRAMILLRMGDVQHAKESMNNASSNSNSNNNISPSSMSIMVLIAHGAVCLQHALSINDVDDATRHALLGEARRALSGALQKSNISHSGDVIVADVTVIRLMLAQVEYSGTMRKKEEKVAQHVDAVLKSAERPLRRDVLALLGELIGSDVLKRKAVFVEPWNVE